MTDDDIYRWLEETEPSPKDNPSRIDTGQLDAIYTTPGEPIGSFSGREYRQSGIADWAAEKEYSEKAGRTLRVVFALAAGSLLVSGLAVIAALWIWGNR